MAYVQLTLKRRKLRKYQFCSEIKALIPAGLDCMKETLTIDYWSFAFLCEIFGV